MTKIILKKNRFWSQHCHVLMILFIALVAQTKSPCVEKEDMARFTKLPIRKQMKYLQWRYFDQTVIVLHKPLFYKCGKKNMNIWKRWDWKVSIKSLVMPNLVVRPSEYSEAVWCWKFHVRRYIMLCYFVGVLPFRITFLLAWLCSKSELDRFSFHSTRYCKWIGISSWS